MLTKTDYEKFSKAAMEYLDKAGIASTDEERKNIEVAEYELGCIEKVGLELVVYVNTERCCAKSLYCFRVRHVLSIAILKSMVKRAKRKHSAPDTARFTFMLKAKA